MSSQHVAFDTTDISDTEYESISQASDQSRFRTEHDSDPDYEDESQELKDSENLSSEEFSQVNRSFLNSHSTDLVVSFYLAKLRSSCQLNASFYQI